LADLLGQLLEKDVDVLVRLARAGATFFCSAKGEAFADVMLNGSRVTWPLSSAELSEWLIHLFYLDRQKAPTPAAVKSATRTLGAHGRFEGARHEVYLRIAEFDGKIYLDLGDLEWRCVEIDKRGWQIIKDAPVRFRRTPAMVTLPLPERGGSINQLRRFVNLTDAGFVLFVSALADALRPGVPHPVLNLVGEEGRAKSTAAKIFLSLVDPSSAPLRSLPNTMRDFFVNAHGAQALAFDNVSSISPAISDALCQIASGSGAGFRKLYTDIGLITIEGSRSVILTSVVNAVTRPDLVDRALTLALPVLEKENRRAETELWSAFEAERPRIFGALLDVVVHGLSQLPRVRLARPPRMADFAQWAVACEGAFAQPGTFLVAFEAHAAEAVDVVLENDPVATAIVAFMHDRTVWSGTATALLSELTKHDRAEAQPSKWRSWPTDPAILGVRLSRVQGALRKAGIQVDSSRTPDHRRRRILELRQIEVQSTEVADDGGDVAENVSSNTRKSGAVIPFR
jgi:hypothetical protein